MVSVITNFGRSGLHDWVVQRISAVLVAAYCIFLLGFWFLHPHAHYAVWYELFNSQLMRFATFFTLAAVAVHAWIGVWTICTDYIKESWLRLQLFVVVYIALVFYLIWGIQILWV